MKFQGKLAEKFFPAELLDERLQEANVWFVPCGERSAWLIAVGIGDGGIVIHLNILLAGLPANCSAQSSCFERTGQDFGSLAGECNENNCSQHPVWRLNCEKNFCLLGETKL
jgi:hypothetical protein